MHLYNLQVLQHSNQSLGFITVLANVSTVECFEGVTQMPLNIRDHCFLPVMLDLVECLYVQLLTFSRQVLSLSLLR